MSACPHAYVPRGYFQDLREECDEGVVCGAIDGRRRQAHEESSVPRAGNPRDAGAWDDFDRDGNAVRRFL
jgi:hypothetical protein